MFSFLFALIVRVPYVWYISNNPLTASNIQYSMVKPSNMQGKRYCHHNYFYFNTLQDVLLSLRRVGWKFINQNVEKKNKKKKPSFGPPFFCGGRGLKNKYNNLDKEGRGYCLTVIVTHSEAGKVCWLRDNIYLYSFHKAHKCTYWLIL